MSFDEKDHSSCTRNNLECRLPDNGEFGFARVFDLTGFVYNLDDRQIRIIAEGDKNNLDAFVDAIQIVSMASK